MIVLAAAAGVDDPAALFLVFFGAYVIFLLGCLLATPLKGKWGSSLPAG